MHVLSRVPSAWEPFSSTSTLGSCQPMVWLWQTSWKRRRDPVQKSTSKVCLQNNRQHLIQYKLACSSNVRIFRAFGQASRCPAEESSRQISRTGIRRLSHSHRTIPAPPLPGDRLRPDVHAESKGCWKRGHEAWRFSHHVLGKVKLLLVRCAGRK